jgi:hypothetical protein
LFSDYQIVAKSLEDYVEGNRNQHGEADKSLLGDVDPIGSEMIQIYLGEGEEESEEM